MLWLSYVYIEEEELQWLGCQPVRIVDPWARCPHNYLRDSPYSPNWLINSQIAFIWWLFLPEDDSCTRFLTAWPEHIYITVSANDTKTKQSISRWGHLEFVNLQHCLAKQSCFLNINYSAPPSHQYIMGEGEKEIERGTIKPMAWYGLWLHIGSSV